MVYSAPITCVIHRSSAYLPQMFFEQRDQIIRGNTVQFVVDFKPFRPPSDPASDTVNH